MSSAELVMYYISCSSLLQNTCTFQNNLRSPQSSLHQETTSCFHKVNGARSVSLLSFAKSSHRCLEQCIVNSMPSHHLVAKAASASTLTYSYLICHAPSAFLRSPPRPQRNYGYSCVHSRRFSRPLHISTFLLPPVVFTGLVIALYTWKCFVMVSLQNKIIYAPYLPPSARHEKIADYQSRNCGIEWKEIRMKSIDGTDLALAVATVSTEAAVPKGNEVTHHVYVLYLQGLFVLILFHDWID